MDAPERTPSGVYYQIYPRSWADADGDGVGDLNGIIARLDHLTWLGVDGVWLNPVTPSPDADWGYDVSDYRGVHPDLGTLADLDRLVEEAHARGLRVLLDLVPNHTSDRHPWFVESRSSRDSSRRGWYVWAAPGEGGAPPNNWQSVFGGPAWRLDEATGEYHLHLFLEQQPDLNWWNEDVRREFDEILRFWFDRGIDGFRIDVVHMLIHDRELRGNPPSGPEDHPEVRRLGQRQIQTANRPEVHEILRRWRRIADEYAPRRLLVGETYLFDLAVVANYFGHGDELHHAFNFPFVFSEPTARALAEVVETTEELFPSWAEPAWTASNHDAGRFPSRWCDGDVAAAKAVLLLLLTLRGTTFLYYGDEIGMRDAEVPRERLRDPAGIATWPAPGRDRCRTPMQWSHEPGAGFTVAGVEPWLPFGDLGINVADQRDDPASVLSLCRSLVSLRRERYELRTGAYRLIGVDGGLWMFRRGGSLIVCLNLSSSASIPVALEGTVLAATDPGKVGKRVGPQVTAGPWEGFVVEATPDR